MSYGHQSSAQAGRQSESSDVGEMQAGCRQADLPDYRLTDIRQHRTAEMGVWVTYGEGVYDISDFMVGHPGGSDRIRLAAGGSVEPFWDVYAIHKTSHVLAIFESMRVGNVHPDDVVSVVQSSPDEPQRHPALRVHASRPFNAETPEQLLIDDFITPNDLFYVRNHLPVPVEQPVDVVELTGVGLRRPVSLSVSDLRREFRRHTVTTTMPCAGTRRSHMSPVDGRAVRGLPWGVGSVGTARWTGVLLRDVLEWAGAREDLVNHVRFQGGDTDHEGQPYEVSVPASTAFDRRRDVLLAYEMNGQQLPLDHGYPLRVIVPGTVGARQVKWLRTIILSTDESQSFWQQNDYKTVNPSTSWETADLSQVTEYNTMIWRTHAQIFLLKLLVQVTFARNC